MFTGRAVRDAAHCTAMNEETRPPQSSAPAGATPSVVSPAPPTQPSAPAPAPSSAQALTPEEQMALFEKELKEQDWGHQPC